MNVIRFFRRRVLILFLFILIGILVILRKYNITDDITDNVTDNLHLLKTYSNDGNGKTHIAFLKIHKAASSTIQNTILRFGYQRNLTFVVANRHNFYPQVISSEETITSANIEPPPKNKTFDIVCCHAIYNRSAFRAIMPRDTVYLASVREPFQLFVSIIHYFRPSYVFKINSTDPISTFLSNQQKYEPRHAKLSFTNNRLAYEFGCPNELIQGRQLSEFQNYLKQIDKDFELIMVVEYIAESFVLLRRKLYWKIQDVLFVIKNSYDDLDDDTKRGLTERFYVNQSTKEMFRKWAVFDYALYDFAKQRLFNQIEDQDETFKEEVSYFKYIQNKVEDFCLNVSKPYKRINLNIPQTKWNERFSVDSTFCAQMTIPERTFIEEIRLKQYGF